MSGSALRCGRVSIPVAVPGGRPLRRGRPRPIRSITLAAIIVSAAAGCGDATGPVLTPGERCGSEDGAVASFADPGLEAKVRAALELTPEEALTCGRAASLEFLGANEAGIRDLTGIENLTGLTELLLAGNAIEDLGPLRALTGLEYLDVRNNLVSDIGPLSGLTRLVGLSLGRNRISDLSPVRNMSALELFGASHNQVADLAPLAGMQGLLILGPERTTVTDLAPLSEMLYLTTIVLDYNRDLTDISPLINNPGVGRDDVVQLQGTGVSCEDIALLVAKRATVISACP